MKETVGEKVIATSTSLVMHPGGSIRLAGRNVRLD